MIVGHFDDVLKGDLRTRLNMIIQEVPHFWDQGPHAHFTLQGPAHSERVHRQKLAQLAQELPEQARLTPDEIFIVSAAAWLYEIGMQCTTLRPILDFDWQPDTPLSPIQLLQIREHKHLLAQQMILDSVRRDYSGPPLRLGLVHPDDYTQLIAEVCRWCSAEPLEQVPEKLPVSGVMVRVRLLVALLRLADQLYIDSSRVNLDLLQVVPLPLKQKVRWWVYHYTQTLPIDRGLIKFYYFLPHIHRDLLGHIRALIEPDFDDGINPVMRYLVREHRLQLLTDEPSIRYDQPAGFQREMSKEMVFFLRQNIQPVAETPSAGGMQSETAVKDHCLLVLDFENFLLQLGLEGYFLSSEETSRVLVTLLKETRDQFPGGVDGLAVGHWTRPDLVTAAHMLKERTYSLLPVGLQAKSSEVLQQELQERFQHAQLPKQILLIAPQQALASTIKQFERQQQAVSTWITDNQDSYIFQAFASYKFLLQVLKLPAKQKLEMDELEQIQTACILRFMTIAPSGISFEEALTLLRQVASIQGRADWWRLWLINKDILFVETDNNRYALKLNKKHPAVVAVDLKLKLTVETLASLTKDPQGVPQNLLSEALLHHPPFRENSDKIIPFLTLLKTADIVSVNSHITSLPDDQPLWQLNPRSAPVRDLTADSYLPFLILGLDHTMVQTGLPFIHEHTLPGRLRKYVEPGMMDTVYQLALGREWVISKPDTYNNSGGRNFIGVEPNTQKDQVQMIFLNRDILLDVLYKAAPSGLQRDALWLALNKIPRFTLSQNQVDQWLTIFQQDALIQIEKDETDTERDCIRLRLDAPLTRHLFGRMHIYDLILTLRRFLHANNPETGKPESVVTERLAKHMTRRNSKQVATWAIEYAKKIRLVDVTNAGTPSVGSSLLYLRRHNLVYSLDHREQEACQAIVSIVRRLSKPYHNDGWVPQHIVLSEMAKNPSFGYARNEHEYWLNQAVYRHKQLDRQEEPGFPPRFLLRISSQEHH